MGSTYYIKRIFRTKRKPHYGRGRQKRAKTFKSEDSAKKWADAHKIKKYKLVNLREGREIKKIMIVPE